MPPDQEVITKPTIELVISVVAIELVVAAKAPNHIVARVAQKGVITVRSDDRADGDCALSNWCELRLRFCTGNDRQHFRRAHLGKCRSSRAVDLLQSLLSCCMLDCINALCHEKVPWPLRRCVAATTAPRTCLALSEL